MELKLFGISTATKLKNVSVVLLQDTAEGHLLPLVITPEEREEILRATNAGRKHSPMLALASTWNIRFERVVIELDTLKFPTCWLVTTHDGEERSTSLTPAEALSVAIRMHCPITMSREDFNALREDGADRVRIPLQRMSSALLQEALENAVEEEDFRTAAALRDEINRTK